MSDPAPPPAGEPAQPPNDHPPRTKPEVAQPAVRIEGTVGGDVDRKSVV